MLVTLILLASVVYVFYLSYRQSQMTTIIVERQGKIGVDAITSYRSLTAEEKKSLTSARSFARDHLGVAPKTANELCIGIKDGEADTLIIVFFKSEWFDWEAGDFIPVAYGGFPYYFEISTNRITGRVVDSYAAPE